MQHACKVSVLSTENGPYKWANPSKNWLGFDHAKIDPKAFQVGSAVHQDCDKAHVLLYQWLLALSKLDFGEIWSLTKTIVFSEPQCRILFQSFILLLLFASSRNPFDRLEGNSWGGRTKKKENQVFTLININKDWNKMRNNLDDIIYITILRNHTLA